MQGSSAGLESLYLEEPNVELSARVAFQFFLSCYLPSSASRRQTHLSLYQFFLSCYVAVNRGPLLWPEKAFNSFSVATKVAELLKELAKDPAIDFQFFLSCYASRPPPRPPASPRLSILSQLLLRSALELLYDAVHDSFNSFSVATEKITIFESVKCRELSILSQLLLAAGVGFTLITSLPSFQFFLSCYTKRRRRRSLGRSSDLSILSQLLPKLEWAAEIVAEKFFQFFPSCHFLGWGNDSENKSRSFNSFPVATPALRHRDARVARLLSILSQLPLQSAELLLFDTNWQILSILSQLPLVVLAGAPYLPPEVSSRLFQFFPSCHPI